MDAVPHPTIPKRTGLISVIQPPMVRHLFPVEPADEIWIRVNELGLRGKCGEETLPSTEIRRISRHTATRISERIVSMFKLPDPICGGLDLHASRLGIDPIEPRMAAAVTANVHSTGRHFLDLLHGQVIVSSGLSLRADMLF